MKLFLIVLISASIIRNIECRTACKVKGNGNGYEDKNGDCWCAYNVGKTKDFINGKVSLGYSSQEPVASFKKESESTGRIWYNKSNDYFEY